MSWETEEYWNRRIVAYLNRESHPGRALPQRVMYVAAEGPSIVGMIAGHLTRRLGCQGELEWIDVIPERRGGEVSSGLLRMLVRWFAAQNAFRVCVDVEPANLAARRFYARHGAVEYRAHWMVWEDITRNTANS